MPEFPDITIYIEALEKRTLGQKLERVPRAKCDVDFFSFAPILSFLRIGFSLVVKVDEDCSAGATLKIA